MSAFLSLVVLRCCLGEFRAYFLTNIVLGVIVSRFINERRINLRLGGILLVLYVIFEGIATGIYHGHLSGLLAVILGLFSLGLSLGCFLFCGFDFLWSRSRSRKKYATKTQEDE